MTITEIEEKDGLIIRAKYLYSLSDDQNTVETEGHWFFQEPQLNVPFDQVTEEMIVSWIEKEAIRDGKNIIKSRLEEQLADLAKAKKSALPWMPQTFTV
jgi:hypothetical protein